jgi:hypothetical protein
MKATTKNKLIRHKNLIRIYAFFRKLPPIISSLVLLIVLLVLSLNYYYSITNDISALLAGFTTNMLTLIISLLIVELYFNREKKDKDVMAYKIYLLKNSPEIKDIGNEVYVKFNEIRGKYADPIIYDKETRKVADEARIKMEDFFQKKIKEYSYTNIENALNNEILEQMIITKTDLDIIKSSLSQLTAEIRSLENKM